MVGYRFSPRLADIGGARFWRVDPAADYGALDGIARHRINTGLIARHWDDLLRLAGSLQLGLVQAHGVMRTLQVAERPTRLALAVAEVTRQHASVEAGDFLRILETHSKLESRELKDVRRQTQADYNLAVRAMAQGQAAAGFEQLDRLGWIKEGQANYLSQAAGDYVRRSLAGQDVLGVAPTWAETRKCVGSSCG